MDPNPCSVQRKSSVKFECMKLTWIVIWSVRSLESLCQSPFYISYSSIQEQIKIWLTLSPFAFLIYFSSLSSWLFPSLYFFQVFFFLPPFTWSFDFTCPPFLNPICVFPPPFKVCLVQATPCHLGIPLPPLRLHGSLTLISYSAKQAQAK